jgi:hypothetical protein
MTGGAIHALWVFQSVFDRDKLVLIGDDRAQLPPALCGGDRDHPGARG